MLKVAISGGWKVRVCVLLLLCCGCFLFGKKKSKKVTKKQTPKAKSAQKGACRVRVALEVVGEGVEFAQKPFSAYVVKALRDKGIVAAVGEGKGAEYRLGGKLVLRVVSHKERYIEDDWGYEMSGEWRLYREVSGGREVKVVRRLTLRAEGRGRALALHRLFSDAAKKIASSVKLAP